MLKHGIGWFGAVFSHSHAKNHCSTLFPFAQSKHQTLPTALLNTGKNPHSISLLHYFVFYLLSPN